MYLLVITAPETGHTKSIRVADTENIPLWAEFDKVCEAEKEYRTITVWDVEKNGSLYSYTVNRPSRTPEPIDMQKVDEWVKEYLMNERGEISKIQMIKLTRERFNGLGLREALAIVQPYFVC